jgi:hypothetical protein
LRDRHGGSAKSWGNRVDTGNAAEAFGEWAAFDGARGTSKGGSAESFDHTGNAVEAFEEWAAFDNGASNVLNSANITQKLTGLGGASKAANSVSRTKSALDHREYRFCHLLHRPC